MMTLNGQPEQDEPTVRISVGSLIATLQSLPPNALIVLPTPRLGVIIPGDDATPARFGSIEFSDEEVQP